MKTINTLNINVGDTISFISKNDCLTVLKVSRVTESSCYTDGIRNSWGTINKLSKLKNFTITKHQ